MTHWLQRAFWSHWIPECRMVQNLPGCVSWYIEYYWIVNGINRPGAWARVSDNVHTTQPLMLKRTQPRIYPGPAPTHFAAWRQKVTCMIGHSDPKLDTFLISCRSKESSSNRDDIFEITDDELRIFSFTLCVDFAQKCARNPSLPWLQIQLVFPFGVAWFSPSAPTPRYIVACLIQMVLAEPHWFHKPFTRNDQRVVYDGCSSGHRAIWKND